MSPFSADVAMQSAIKCTTFANAQEIAVKTTLIICLTCLCLYLPVSASAQSDGERFGNWLYSCSDGPCQGYFSLKHPGSDATALTLGLLRPNADEQSTLIITLPEMTALRPGIQLILPDVTPLTVMFEFCNDRGCTGFAPLQPEQLAAMKNSTQVEVRFFEYGVSAPKSYKIPITGFAGLYERLGVR